MNRRLLILLFPLLAGFPVLGQQVPFYNHNMVNPFIFNPSMAGYSGDVNAFLVRNQRYTAFNGASVNNYLSIDGTFLKNKGGFGFQIAHQAHGIQQQLSSSFTYAYRIRLRKYNDLRFGFTAGLLDNRINLSSINVYDQNDPYLATMRPKVSSFDMNVGATYIWNSLKVGLAVPQIVGNKVSFDKENTRGYYRLARHIMLSGEYDFPLWDKDVVLRPNVIVRYVPGAPLQYDVAGMLDHAKIGWASLGYKSDYSIQMNVGFRIMQQFKVGYSYEYLIGSMKHYSTGAHHELMLGFIFRAKGKEVVKEVVKVVEKEKKVEVLVEDEETKRENEELKKQNEELEKLLKEALAEKEELEKRQEELVEERKEMQEEREQLVEKQEQLEKENEQLQVEQENKEKEPQIIPVTKSDTVKKQEQIVPVNTEEPEEEEIPIAKGYKLVKLDMTDAPDGYYVVGGVFSSKKNAESVLVKNGNSYPGSYLVINQRNGFYYVILLYTTDPAEARETAKRFERSSGRDSWILNYISD